MPPFDTTTIKKWSFSFTILSFLFIHTVSIVWWASTQTNLTKQLSKEIIEIRQDLDTKISETQYVYFKNSLDLAIQDMKLTIKEGTKDRIYKGEALQIIENLNNKILDNTARAQEIKQQHKEDMQEIKADIRDIKTDVRELLTRKR